MATNSEFEPIGIIRTVSGNKTLCWYRDAPEGSLVYTAPPAAAAPGKPRLSPRMYADCVNMLQEMAIAFHGTGQLRARLNSVLGQYVEPDHPHTRAAMLQPVSKDYTLPAGFCDAGLTRFDLSALQKMPESEWFSWRDDRLKGVNRPHYRCFRLLEAGFLESRVTNPEAPYQSVEFRKIEAQTTPAAPDEIDRFVDQVCGDKPADHQQ